MSGWSWGGCQCEGPKTTTEEEEEYWMTLLDSEMHLDTWETIVAFQIIINFKELKADLSKYIDKADNEKYISIIYFGSTVQSLYNSHLVVFLFYFGVYSKAHFWVVFKAWNIIKLVYL